MCLQEGLSHAGSPLEAVDAVACGVDLVDASFAVHATSAGHALLLEPKEWMLHDAELSGMPAVESAPPSAVQQQAAAPCDGSQHAHRLHGKQRSPRNKPEVTMKAMQGSAEMPVPAAGLPADNGQQQLPSGQDTRAEPIAEPRPQGTAHTGGADATGHLQASARPAFHLAASDVERDVAGAAVCKGLAAGQQTPAETSKGEGMQNKRGLAEEAPSHVKHPRHRADSNQGHVVEQLAGSQDGGAASGHPGYAPRWGRQGQTGSSAPGTQAAPRKPEPPGSQQALPSSITHDMWKVHHRADSRPLSKLCACFTCQRHSRAYIHHLLKTKEMLAQVLPMIACHDWHDLLQYVWAVCIPALPSPILTAVLKSTLFGN